MAEGNGNVWLSGDCLVEGNELASEVSSILGKLGVMAELKEGARVCLKGADPEILKGLSDIAKASVSASFWLVGKHLLNGGQSPNGNVKKVLVQLGIAYLVINSDFQAPMIQLRSNDEQLIKGVNLIAKSKFVC